MGAGGKIAGYAVANDVSARDLQRREPQWTRAKGADGFCPWGPWITTADEVPDPQNLRITTHVNGELRQDSSTSDLIFGPQELVDFISETCTLEPGDLILTGTPSGVGMSMDPRQFLASGDVDPDRDRVTRRDRACHRLIRSSASASASSRTCGTPGTCWRWDQQVMMPAERRRRARRGARRRSAGCTTTGSSRRELGALLDAAPSAEPQIVARRPPRPRRRAARPGRARPPRCRAPARTATPPGCRRARPTTSPIFEPALRRNIELARRYAACFPEAEHPYDPLLDRYEPGTTAAQVSRALRAAARRGSSRCSSEIALQPARQALRGRLPDRRAARGRPGDRRGRWASTPSALAPRRRRPPVRRLAVGQRRARHLALRRAQPDRPVRAHARGRPRPLRARRRPGARAHDARHRRLARRARVAEPAVGEPRRPQPGRSGRTGCRACASASR